MKLINQRDLLSRRGDELQQKLDAASLRLAAISTGEAEAEAAHLEALANLKARDEECLQAKRSLADADLDTKRLRMELDHMKQDSERREADIAREREAALLQAKEAASQALKDDLGKRGNESDASSQARLRAERKSRDLEREAKRARDDLEAMQGEKVLLDEELAQLRQTFRQTLALQLAAPGNAYVKLKLL